MAGLLTCPIGLPPSHGMCHSDDGVQTDLLKDLQQRVLFRILTWFPFQPWRDGCPSRPPHYISRHKITKINPFTNQIIRTIPSKIQQMKRTKQICFAFVSRWFAVISDNHNNPDNKNELLMLSQLSDNLWWSSMNFDGFDGDSPLKPPFSLKKRFF